MCGVHHEGVSPCRGGDGGRGGRSLEDRGGRHEQLGAGHARAERLAVLLRTGDHRVSREGSPRRDQKVRRGEVCRQIMSFGVLWWIAFRAYSMSDLDEILRHSSVHTCMMSNSGQRNSGSDSGSLKSRLAACDPVFVQLVVKQNLFTCVFNHQQTPFQWFRILANALFYIYTLPKRPLFIRTSI